MPPIQVLVVLMVQLAIVIRWIYLENSDLEHRRKTTGNQSQCPRPGYNAIARRALSIRSLTPTQVEDAVPPVAEALLAAERDAARLAANICEFITDEYACDCKGASAKAIRAAFNITE